MQKKKIFQKNANKQREYHEKRDGTERHGLVVAHFGASAEVEDETGRVYHVHLRRNAEPCITGDRVLWRLESNDTAVVVGVLPRQSLLARPEGPKKTKLIAANIDQMVIATAPYPLFSDRLIDRYIVAAESLAIRPVILFNKMDLCTEQALLEVQARLARYTALGYQVVYSSVKLPGGLDSLAEALNNKVSIFVGVSGVGKSSMIAALTGDASIRIGEVGISGKHTTTTTRLYHLSSGGSLIDSPGVREFMLSHLEAEAILRGFIEIASFVGSCKFRNCQHHHEPGCAVLQALQEHKISQERWESYREILQDMRK